MRYWLYTMLMPDKEIQKVQHDADELWWKKDPELDSKRRIRRFVAQRTAVGPRSQGGVNNMPWKDHVHAVQAETILRYLHPADSDWKLVLDTMLLQDGCRKIGHGGR